MENFSIDETEDLVVTATFTEGLTATSTEDSAEVVLEEDPLAKYRTMTAFQLRMVPTDELRQLLVRPLHFTRPNFSKFVAICQDAGAFEINARFGLTQA